MTTNSSIVQRSLFENLITTSHIFWVLKMEQRVLKLPFWWF